MNEQLERDIHRAVGMSDWALLLSEGFRFPSRRLFFALTRGGFIGDWRSSAADACGALSRKDESLAALCAGAFSEGSCEESMLRREYSRLFLAPGLAVSVWPYESCFRHRAAGAEGAPSLFRTPVALDVERRMHEAGVAPVDEHREPGDSIFRELEFLAYLHARRGEALRTGNAAEGAAWSSRLAGFAEAHALAWMPAFMGEVRGLSRMEAYRCLADLGARYLGELEIDVRRLAAKAGR